MSDLSRPTTLPLKCRFLVDPPADGALNMAVDEALLNAAAFEGHASLRFYQWSKPTLSLGYFQRYADRDQNAASRKAAVVRRTSGGGALIHDRELTYCLCLPAAHSRSRQSAQLYGLVHDALISILKGLGTTARLQNSLAAAESPQPAQQDTFLCFARRSAFDVVCFDENDSTIKIVGSAQRRLRGAVMQHGAVLLGTSSLAPELRSLEQACGKAFSPADLIGPWSEQLALQLDLELLAEPASDSIIDLTLLQSLVTKHASGTWVMRR